MTITLLAAIACIAAFAASALATIVCASMLSSAISQQEEVANTPGAHRTT